MAACSFTHYGRTFTLTVEETSYSVENNTSNIKWTLSITGGGSTYYDSYAKATVNGSVVFNASKGWSTYTFPAKDGSVSGTMEGIPHDNEGRASVSFALEGYCYYYTTQYTNGSLTLTTIPRASIPTCNNVTLGNAVTINTNRYSSSFTHTINIKQGSTTIETFTGIGASKSWTPAIATYAPKITSASTGTFTIECLTYSGSTHIGTKSCSVVLTVPSSVKPSASVRVAEADATMLGKNWGVYVKGKSKLTVTVTGTPIYSSPITSYSSSTNGQSSTSSSWTTNFLSTVGTNSVNATVGDSRGNTSNTASTSYTVVDYTKPTISTAVCARCDANGNEKDNGTYLKYSFIGSISSVNNKNSKEFKLGYKLRNESSYQYVTLENSSYNIMHSGIILSGVTFSADSTYDIIFTATDSFESTTINREIGTGFDMINVHASGQSMAIGKKSEASNTDKKLEIALETDISNNTRIQGNLTVLGNSSLRQYQIWHDGNARWYRLGTVKLDAQCDYAIFNLYVGDGQNGGAFQMALIKLVFKRGYLPSGGTSSNVGGYYTIEDDGTDAGAYYRNNVWMQVRCTETGYLDVYYRSPSAYGGGFFTIEGNYASFNVDVSSVSGEPSNGTAQDIRKISNTVNPYPVGAVYMSTDGTYPGTLFGGEWVQIYDRFLIAAGSGYSIGSTGGATTSSGYGSHSHSTTAPGGHAHSFYWGSGSVWNGWISTVEGPGWRDHYNQSSYGIASAGDHSHTANATGSSFSIMPPYYAVYMWRRTA